MYLKTAVVVAGIAAAAAVRGEVLWPGPDTVMRPQADSSIATLADGSVEVTACADGTVFTGVPVYDSPCLITERRAIDIDEITQ